MLCELTQLGKVRTLSLTIYVFGITSGALDAKEVEEGNEASVEAVFAAGKS